MSRIPRTLPVQGNFYEAVVWGYADFSVAAGDGNGSLKSLGIFPAGCTIMKPISGANIDVAFNATTLNTIDVGTAATPTLYGSALAAGAIDFVPLDEAVAMTLTEDTELFARLNTSGEETAGEGRVIISALIPVNGSKTPNPPSNP